jgi:hypothetical protein
MAAFLLGIYTDRYIDDPDYSFSLEILGQMILQNASRGSLADPYDLASDYKTIAHARVYGIADYYHADGLRNYAATQFIALIRSPSITIDELFDNIELLYKKAYTAEPTLRAWVVYFAQRIHRQIVGHSGFDHLIHTYNEFAYEFGNEWHRANWLWCPECNRKIVLHECQCGFSGLCGYRYCTNQDLSKMKCTKCGKRGHLLKNMPAEDLDEEKLNGKRVADAMIQEVAYDAAISPPLISPLPKKKAKRART